MRVAWLLETGLAVVDLQDGANVTPLLGSEGQVFLTGFPSAQSNTRLTISKDGNFLLAASQKSFTAVPDFRIIDLRVEKRRAMLGTLDGEQLREIACQVVSFLPPSNSSGEMTALLSNANPASSVCE